MEEMLEMLYYFKDDVYKRKTIEVSKVSRDEVIDSCFSQNAAKLLNSNFLSLLEILSEMQKANKGTDYQFSISRKCKISLE